MGAGGPALCRLLIRDLCARRPLSAAQPQPWQVPSTWQVPSIGSRAVGQLLQRVALRAQPAARAASTGLHAVACCRPGNVAWAAAGAAALHAWRSPDAVSWHRCDCRSGTAACSGCGAVLRVRCKITAAHVNEPTASTACACARSAATVLLQPPELCAAPTWIRAARNQPSLTSVPPRQPLPTRRVWLA